MDIRNFATLTVLASAGFFTTLGLAQDRIEDVVVTAEKREASLQDTAIAITAVSGDSLRALQLEEIQDVLLRTPSAAFSRAGGEGQVYIRGVGANLLGIGQDSSVAIHQDGVYLGRPNLTLNQFLDVERVEILRGPQGTLYGRNATAGVVNVISKMPGEEYEGFVSGYYGNFNRAEIETGVGGPISDTLGFRVAGRWAQDDGFTDDLDPRGGDTIDDINIWSLRGILDFQPSDAFDGNFILEYGKSDNNNRSVRRRDRQHLSQLGDGQPDTVGGLPAFACPGCPAAQNPAFNETRNELDTFHEWDVLGATLTLNFDLGGGIDLVSITGYREFEDEFSFNTDGAEASVTNTQYARSSDQITQELRLSGSNGGFNWLIGGFLMREDKTENLGLPAAKFGGSFNIFAVNDTTAYAIFGEANTALTDQLELVLGLRWNKEEKKDCSAAQFLGGQFDGLNNPNAGADPCGGGNRDDNWEDWTPKIGLNYRVNDDALAYASVTRGFKSGGTNSLSPGSTPFDPESLWSYEIGLKSEFYDGKMQLNLAGFYYDYTDLQVSTFDADSGTTRIENAASAEVLGIEAEFSAILVDGLVFNFGATWLDTEYKDFVTTNGNIPGTDPAQPNVVDLSGNNLINAPELKIVTNLRYDWNIGDNTLYAFGQYTWQDDIFHSQFNEAAVGQAAYGLLDLRAGFIFGADDQFEIAVVGKNLTDEEFFQNSVRFTSLSNTATDPGQVGAALGYPGEGRSYGVQLRYGF